LTTALQRISAEAAALARDNANLRSSLHQLTILVTAAAAPGPLAPPPPQLALAHPGSSLPLVWGSLPPPLGGSGGAPPQGHAMLHPPPLLRPLPSAAAFLGDLTQARLPGGAGSPAFGQSAALKRARLQ